MNKHTFDYMYFGPLLMRSNIDEDFRLGLLERASKLNEKKNGDLAGHIAGQYTFTQDDCQYFIDNIRPQTDRYISDLNQLIGLKKPLSNCDLTSMWVNYMKPGEYNPPHIHDNSLSFVVFLDVPEEIINETKNVTMTHTGPGSLDFLFGEIMPNSRSHYTVIPKSGDVYIFNALLRHMVAPFKSNNTRISMSGNFNIT